MDINTITVLKDKFDSCKQYTYNKVDFWYARDLADLMGYSMYDFLSIINNTIKKLRDYRIPGIHIVACYTDIDETQKSPLGFKCLMNYIVDRYGAYLITKNADSSKIEVKFAEEYFLQSDDIELLNRRLEDRTYIDFYNNYLAANNSFKYTLHSRNITDDQRDIIFDNTNKGLFDKNTKELNEMYDLRYGKAVEEIFGPRLITYKTVALLNTEQEIINKDTNDIEEICHIAFEEHSAIRNMIKEKYKKNTEDLITGEDIEEVMKTYSNKLYSNKLTDLESKLVDTYKSVDLLNY